MLRPLSFVVLLCMSSTAIAEPANILFIAIDDLKPVLGCYGDQKAITPSIDKIAKQGTVFLNAQCQWPVCGPSRASLMSSLRPEANGVMNLKTDIRHKDPDILTLPQHFRNNGYTTAGAGKIYDPRCVDSKRLCDAPSWSIPFVTPSQRGVTHDAGKRFASAPEVGDDQLMDGQIALAGIKLMQTLADSDEPFFLAVGFKKPHLPFAAPKKYWDQYSREQFKLPPHRGGIENASGYTLHQSSEFRGYGDVPKEGKISEELQLEAMHGYYACATYVDAQVGRLVAELEQLGLAENTSIVLWGDHGFHLGDHGMWGKHSTLEQAARVPLIVRPYSGKAVPSSDSPVEFTDVFPTVCDLAELEVPTQISGRSLLPIVRGDADAIRNGAITVFKSKGALGYSYRNQRYRYTEWINKRDKIVAAELYDYQVDPLETKNLIDDPNYSATRETMALQMRAEGKDCPRLQATDVDAVSMYMHHPSVNTLDAANGALQKLIKGNELFIAGESKHPHGSQG